MFWAKTTFFLEGEPMQREFVESYLLVTLHSEQFNCLMLFHIASKNIGLFYIIEMFACIYWSGRGKVPKKDHIGAKIEKREKFMSEHMSLIVVWICAALLPMRLRVANGSSY